MTVAAALLVVFAGLAVGATSIGGILVVPALTSAAALPVGTAVAASSFSFLFTGLASIAMRRNAGRTGAAPDRPLLPLCAGALAGAAAGALTLSWLPSTAVRLGVALLAVLSGILALARDADPDRETPARPPRVAAQVALGVLVGCASAWSGTGGPVVLLPLLIVLRAPTQAAVAMAQAIQVPIALAATGVNLAAGQLDLMLGLALGALLMLGWWAGWRLGHRLPVTTLRRLVAGGLIAIGLAYAWQTLQG